MLAQLCSVFVQTGALSLKLVQTGALSLKFQDVIFGYWFLIFSKLKQYCDDCYLEAALAEFNGLLFWV